MDQRLYRPRRHYVLRALWRFWITGRPLLGQGDNATFLRDATVDHRGGPVEKLGRARWRRVAARWAVLGVPFLLLELRALAYAGRVLGSAAWWATAPWGTVLALYATVGALAGAAHLGHLLVLWWPQRAVRRTYIYPAAAVLARVTGVKLRRREALAAIQLPPGFGDDVPDEPVRVFVPDVALDAGMRKRIADQVGARLGLPDPVTAWTVAGVARAYVELRPMALPPASITLDSLRAELAASPLDEPIVGVAAGGRVVHTDFRNDSPHTLGSAASGAGKSTLYKLIAMQRMAHGAYAIMLDFKKWSHLRWMGRLPTGRALVEDRVPEIHEILCRVLDELMWRKSFDLHQEAELEALPTIDVYVEEINTLMSLLVDYWTGYRAEQRQAARSAVRRAKEAGGDGLDEAEETLAAAMGLPVTSPAIQALRYGVNLGREFHVHFHFIGQSMSAKAAGGRDTRESFRTRLLARWDRKTWTMLADGIDFIACPSGTVGIWAHVHGSEVDIVRVPNVADADAVAWVLAGLVPALPMFHGDALPSTSRPALSATASLRELAGLLPPPGLSLDALRKAAQRPGFPAAVTSGAGTAALFEVDQVMAWFRDRERLMIDG